jgi:hypothetical protein
MRAELLRRAEIATERDPTSSDSHRWTLPLAGRRGSDTDDQGLVGRMLVVLPIGSGLRQDPSSPGPAVEPAQDQGNEDGDVQLP